MWMYENKPTANRKSEICSPARVYDPRFQRRSQVHFTTFMTCSAKSARRKAKP